MNRKLLSTTTALLTIASFGTPAFANEWIQQSVLAKDHKAYCNDVIGQQARNNTGTSNQNMIGSQSGSNNHSSSQEYQRNKQLGMQGGGGIGPVNFKLGFQSNSSNSGRTTIASANQFSKSWDNSSQHSFDRSTITSESVGKDCSTFVQGASMVEVAKIKADTERAGFQTQQNMAVMGMLLGWPQQQQQQQQQP
jgi:hypothetical protein